MDNYSNDEKDVRFFLWFYITHRDLDLEIKARRVNDKPKFDSTGHLTYSPPKKPEYVRKHYPDVWKEWLEFDKDYPYKGYI